MLLCITGLFLVVPHASAQGPSASIDNITPSTQPWTVGVEGGIKVAIRYSNLDHTVLYVVVTHEAALLGSVDSQPLSGSGRYVFPTIHVTPTAPGDWNLQFSLSSRDAILDTGSATIRVVAAAAGPTSTDWTVDAISLIPADPRVGDQVRFSARVFALSSDHPFPQQVGVDIYADGRLIEGAAILVSRGDQGATVSSSVRWVATSGSHTVAFVADPQNAYNDHNRNNNRSELSFSVSGNPPPAGFDFSITVRPETQTLRPEGSVVYDVYVDLTVGATNVVSLSLSGLPQDATYAFDPSNGRPHFQAKLTVYVPQYTAAGAPMPSGIYTLTITGEAAGLVRSGTTSLVVQGAGIATTQLQPTSMQATLTSAATTQATQTDQGLAEAVRRGGIFLLLLIVVAVALVAYYLGKRRKPTT